MPINEELARLRTEAQRLHQVLRRQARRPFIFEITGTPKAGKTTLIALLDGFLRDCGWRVHILEERAGVCPLPMKGHFFFNTWTTGTMLAGLLDAADRDDDLVILDRGLLDALIWLEIQRTEGQVSSTEAEAFESFVLVERWRRLSDSTCVITLDPGEAMKRENERRLLPRTGSVMNSKRLADFNAALTKVTQSHAASFNVVTFPNDQDVMTGAAALVETLLKQVREWVDKPIAVIPREKAIALVPSGTLDWAALNWEDLSSLVEYHPRSEVEDDEQWVQVLTCGCQVFAGEVFLSVRRRQRTQMPSVRDDSARIWQGCHIEKPADGSLNVEEVSKQLLRRLRTDLHLGELNAKPEPLGLIWHPTDDDRRHLGVVFKVPIEEKIVKFLDEKEFRTNGRGHRVQSSFVSVSEIQPGTSPPEGYRLEPWSLAFLDRKWLP